jgi:phospholipase C
VPQNAAIKNVIVLMLENRSFDNVLGALRPWSTAFEGLTLNEVNYDSSNKPYPIANNPNSTAIPPIDPGEGFMDMNLQIFGNTGATGPASMSGFVLDYLAAPGAYPSIPTPPPAYANCYPKLPRTYTGVTPPPALDGQDIMNYFTTAGSSPQLPVTSALANAFAVSDSWFGSCPTQTFANRLFLHCGTSGGYVDDCPYIDQVPCKFPSVFELLDGVLGAGAVPNWKVYFHSYPIACMIDYVWKASNQKPDVNVCNFDESDVGQYSLTPTFQEDLNQGTLPAYSFIEPRYSNHPLYNPSVVPNSNHPPFDMMQGEILLANVYNQLLASDYWKQSLLIVIYDEHGGCYDHVIPPSNATPPGPNSPVLPDPLPPNVTYPFPATRFGPRVPALIISPFVTAGSVLRPPNFVPNQPSSGMPFDHTSVIATLRDQFGIGALTNRDAAAPSLIPLLSTTAVNLNPKPVPIPPVLPTADESSPPGTATDHLSALVEKLPRPGERTY